MARSSASAGSLPAGGREPGARARPAYPIAVLGKALDLLDVLEDAQPLTLTELSERAGINKATAFRILANFDGRGYVERDEPTGQYRLGFRLIQLGSRVTHSLDLRTVARPWLTRLQADFGETVNLAIPRGHRIVYIDILETARGLRMTSPIGSEDHFHSTALGKAMLAAWPAELARAFAASADLVAKTPHTIVDRARLDAELAGIRRCGYAVDHEENDLGARCIGAALLDHDGQVIGAISVSGPVSRMTVERTPAIAERVVAACGDISARLGYRPPAPAGQPGAAAAGKD